MEKIVSKNHCGHYGHAVVKIVGIVAFAIVITLAIIKDSLWTQYYDSIQVIGQGHVPVVPDAAIVNLGVLTIREDTSDLAIQKTSQALANVDTALEKAGIPKENRQITGYVLNPLFKEVSEGGKSQEIDGYTSSQQITVMIPDIRNNTNRVNEIITIATKAGANQVGEVKMIATNAEDLKQEARLGALADANKKAKNMAVVSGLKLESISNWYESIIAAPGSQYGQNGNNENMPLNQSLSVPSNIIILQPGQLEIVVEITVNYRIKSR